MFFSVHYFVLSFTRFIHSKPKSQVTRALTFHATEPLFHDMHRSFSFLYKIYLQKYDICLCYNVYLHTTLSWKYKEKISNTQNVCYSSKFILSDLKCAPSEMMYLLQRVSQSSKHLEMVFRIWVQFTPRILLYVVYRMTEKRKKSAEAISSEWGCCTMVFVEFLVKNSFTVMTLCEDTYIIVVQNLWICFPPIWPFHQICPLKKYNYLLTVKPSEKNSAYTTPW